MTGKVTWFAASDNLPSDLTAKIAPFSGSLMSQPPSCNKQADQVYLDTPPFPSGEAGVVLSTLNEVCATISRLMSRRVQVEKSEEVECTLFPDVIQCTIDRAVQKPPRTDKSHTFQDSSSSDVDNITAPGLAHVAHLLARH